MSTTSRAEKTDRLDGDGPLREPAGLLYVQAPGHPRPALPDTLSRTGVPATIAGDVGEALRLLADRPFCLVVSDLASERTALTGIRLIRARHPELPLAAVVDAARTTLVGEVLQMGVADLLPWPFEAADLAAILAHHRERAGSEGRPSGGEAAGYDWFLDGTAMRAVREAVASAGSVRHGFVICGEAGSGHELAARAIHASDGAGADTFVHVRCVERADQLELRLFGNQAPARPGADAAHAIECVSAGSILDKAAAGTIYLERIGEAPARVQARLARLLRDREARDEAGAVRPVGPRLIASVEGPLAGAIADGRLGRDLADRLVSQIDLPPLRARTADIPRLAAHYLAEGCRRHGRPMRHFGRAALTLLAAMPWPQNLVDLARLGEAVACGAPGPVVYLEDVLAQARLDTATTRVQAVLTLREARRHVERECIAAALVRHHGRVGDAARALGIQRTNLYRKVRQLDVDRVLLSARRPARGRP